MILVRSAESRDFKDLYLLSRYLNSYNFPHDKTSLKNLIRDSSLSFKGKRLPEKRRRYLFVAENLADNKVVGSSLIIPRHGSPAAPHLALKVDFKGTRKSLQLVQNTRGFTEIGGLVVLPSMRGSEEKIGKQLSYARFAWMGCHPSFFCREAIVEYLPQGLGKNGNAFWRALGGRFLKMSYQKADHLSAHNKEFILSRFPKGKIYIDELPKEAALHLGEPGEGASASLAMLSKIGFKPRGQIDPFDGGPHYSAPLKKISIIQKSRQLFVKKEEHTVSNNKFPQKLVLSYKKGKVRALLTRAQGSKKHILLDPDIIKTLGIKEGDAVCVTPFE